MPWTRMITFTRVHKPFVDGRKLTCWLCHAYARPRAGGIHCKAIRWKRGERVRVWCHSSRCTSSINETVVLWRTVQPEIDILTFPRFLEFGEGIPVMGEGPPYVIHTIINSSEAGALDSGATKQSIQRVALCGQTRSFWARATETNGGINTY